MSNTEVEKLKEELEESRQRNAELTARLTAEISSRDAPSWLHATLDTADIGVWEWDITLGKVTWSEAIYRNYGYTHEAFDGTLEGVVNATSPRTARRWARASSTP